jgi:hypothetical protein
VLEFAINGRLQNKRCLFFLEVISIHEQMVKLFYNYSSVVLLLFLHQISSDKIPVAAKKKLFFSAFI